MRKAVTAPDIRSRKNAVVREPLVMVTAYDAPTARIADAASVDVILVGDSVAMVVLGYDDTLSVTTDDMAHHVAAVARGLAAGTASADTAFPNDGGGDDGEHDHPRPLVVGDLPWMSYHVSREETVRNAAALVRAGAAAVKLEGGAKRIPAVEAILDAEIPVMGHLGLTPQSVHALGGYKVQGKEAGAARRLLDDAVALAETGCFSIVLECIPDEVARAVTEAVDVPTIGIGAGPHCDGQVLVFHDLTGLDDRIHPKFVRRYGSLKADATAAVAAFAEDVRAGRFPTAEESYSTGRELGETLGLYGTQSA